MVRPEGRQEARRPCFTEPAGESPVPVSVGAPGSWLQPREETCGCRAERQKPSAAQAAEREQDRGPQRQVKPAASSQIQSGSRAAHVTAKTTSSVSISGGALDPGGVEGAARDQGSVRNRRDPSAQPRSGQGRSYKPKAKSSVVQRESEGAVVLMMTVQKNAAGGKDPCSGYAEGDGKRWGMTETARSNHPRGQWLVDKARERIRQLWTVAKPTQAAGRCVAAPRLRSDARSLARKPRASADASPVRKTTGKPDAGNRHVRFERRRVETGRI